MSLRPCFYTILDVPVTATQDDLKKAFRKQALLHHPDKNPGDPEAATRKFQSIQDAYEVLRDPQERAWYDGHKDDFLRKDTLVDYSGEQRSEFFVEIWPFCHRDAFRDFSDNPGCFYSVYAGMFAKIDAIEIKYTEKRLPLFGNSKSLNEDVLKFYRFWSEFVTRTPASHAAKWRLSDAPNTKVRKLMDQENKKLIAAAKREYQDNVRMIVSWVRRRDPRMIRIQKQKALEIARKNEAIAAANAAINEKTRTIFEAARLEQARRAELLRAEVQILRDNGQSFCAYDDEEEETIKAKPKEVFRCLPCKKTFKSVNLFNDHVKSKKHIRAVGEAAPIVGDAVVGDERTTDEGPTVPRNMNTKFPLPRKQQSFSDISQEENSPQYISEQPLEEADFVSPVVDEDDDIAFLLSSFGNRKVSSDSDEPTSLAPENTVDDIDQEELLVCDKGIDEEPDEVAKTDEGIAKKRRRRPKLTKTVTQWRCLECGSNFETRNRLFRHIETEGHAALKKR